MAFEYIAEQIKARSDDGLLRSQKVFDENATLRDFASNDYLGLAKQTLRLEGALGAGGSALVSGYHTTHREVERAFAHCFGYEDALLMQSGFSANHSVIKALMQNNAGCIFADKLAHASIIDGALTAEAPLKRFKHNSMSHLRTLLEQSKAKHKLIVTESVFSMDGDSAPIKDIMALAKTHNAWVLLDDAHGLGTIHCVASDYHGQLSMVEALAHKPEITIMPLGKAFGASGAVVLLSRSLRDFLLQTNREYIYSTHMPPVLAKGLLARFEAFKNATTARLRLKNVIVTFREGAKARKLPMLDSKSPVQACVLGSADAVMQAQAALQAKGILVGAIRPPTVQFNTARLRISLHADHSDDDITALLDALEEHTL